MTSKRIDVNALPEIKLSSDTFELLPEYGDDNSEDQRVGITWKRTVADLAGDIVAVICRWKRVDGGSGVQVEMLRPIITGPVRDDPDTPISNPMKRRKRR